MARKDFTIQKTEVFRAHPKFRSQSLTYSSFTKMLDSSLELINISLYS